MNKKCNAQGSTKSLQRSYFIESMNCDTDCTIASLNVADITTVLKLFNCVETDKLNLFINVTYKQSSKRNN